MEAPFGILSAVDFQLENKSTVIIAIDGMSAGGKTTLAFLLQGVYSCAVIHMDHFFLPEHLRTAERLAQPGGNVHYERFNEEVAPYLGGGDFSYLPFDCSRMEYGTAVHVPAGRLTVVEGSYSLHPLLKVNYDLKVYLTVTPEEQIARILARNGPNMCKRFREEWIPMENAYNAAFSISKNCDLIF